jgi:hypothetical protein
MPRVKPRYGGNEGGYRALHVGGTACSNSMPSATRASKGGCCQSALVPRRHHIRVARKAEIGAARTLRRGIEVLDPRARWPS